MRNTIIATSLAILFGISSVGCKSMPKTASNSAAETAALASTTPTKPSVLAKQAEGLAAAASAGAAPAFVPNLSSTPPAVLAAAPASSAYPSTNAPSFSAAPAANAPVANIAAATPSAGLGSIQLPYNPDAVPPAAQAKVATPVANAASRYATTPTPTSTLPQSTGSTATQPSQIASRYGSYLATVQAAQQAVKTPSTDNLPAAVNAAPPMVAHAESAMAAAGIENGLSPPVPGSMEEIATKAAASLNGRYAQTAPTAYAPAPPVTPAVTTPTPTTHTPQAVASTTPYRPGGTSSYPTTGSTPPSMIASRPEPPKPQVPNTNAHSGADHAPYPVTPQQAPRYR